MKLFLLKKELKELLEQAEAAQKSGEVKVFLLFPPGNLENFSEKISQLQKSGVKFYYPPLSWQEQKLELPFAVKGVFPLQLHELGDLIEKAEQVTAL